MADDLKSSGRALNKNQSVISPPTQSPVESSTADSAAAHRATAFVTSFVNSSKYRRYISQLQRLLIRPGVSQTDFDRSATILRPDDYDLVVEERSNEGLCGLPTCTNAVVVPSGQGLYSISKRDQAIYRNDDPEYCSLKCNGESKVFRAQLSEEPAYMRMQMGQLQSVKQPHGTSAVVPVGRTENASGGHASTASDQRAPLQGGTRVGRTVHAQGHAGHPGLDLPVVERVPQWDPTTLAAPVATSQEQRIRQASTIDGFLYSTHVSGTRGLRTLEEAQARAALEEQKEAKKKEHDREHDLQKAQSSHSVPAERSEDEIRQLNPAEALSDSLFDASKRASQSDSNENSTAQTDVKTERVTTATLKRARRRKLPGVSVAGAPVASGSGGSNAVVQTVTATGHSNQGLQVVKARGVRPSSKRVQAHGALVDDEPGLGVQTEDADNHDEEEQQEEDEEFQVSAAGLPFDVDEEDIVDLRQVKRSPFAVTLSLLEHWSTQEMVAFTKTSFFKQRRAVGKSPEQKGGDDDSAEDRTCTLGDPNTQRLELFQAKLVDAAGPAMDLLLRETSAKGSENLGPLVLREVRLLCRTLLMNQPLPSLTSQQWTLIFCVCLAGLSRRRLPALRVHVQVTGDEKERTPMQTLLEKNGFTVDQFHLAVDTFLDCFE